MQARKALLRKLAAVNWEAASRAFFEGEAWLESRNTIYRFRDGVCFDVASRDPRRTERARTLIGMRLVGWLTGPSSLFTSTWAAGACAVLWRPSGAGGGVSGEEALAMTSASTNFARGPSSVYLQALHDQVPPVDSQTFRRNDAAPAPLKTPAPRPKLPSSSYRSG